MEKFYVTKFWSTDGIVTRDCEVYTPNGQTKTQYATVVPNGHGFYKIGSFAFRTEAAARADVRRRAAKKLAWLEKKAGEIKKLLAELG